MNKIRERNLVFLNLQVHIYEVGVHMRTSIIYFYAVTNLWQSCGRERGRDKRISLISAPSPIFKSLSLSASVTHSTYQMTSTSPTLASPPSQITSPPSLITSPPSPPSPPSDSCTCVSHHRHHRHNIITNSNITITNGDSPSLPSPSPPSVCSSSVPSPSSDSYTCVSYLT